MGGGCNADRACRQNLRFPNPKDPGLRKSSMLVHGVESTLGINRYTFCTLQSWHGQSVLPTPRILPRLELERYSKCGGDMLLGPTICFLRGLIFPSRKKKPERRAGRPPSSVRLIDYRGAPQSLWPPCSPPAPKNQGLRQPSA